MGFVRVAGHESVLWAPLAPEAIDAACHQAFGADTRVVSREAVHHGRFNTTYRIALAARDPVILRVGPPERAPLFRHERQLLARESAVHARLARIGPVIPLVLHRDFSCTILPRPFLFLECKPGTLWDQAAPLIAPAQAEALWREFGAHVRNIHAITGERFGSPLPDEGRDNYADWLLGLFDDLATDLEERKLLVPGLTQLRRALDARRRRLDVDGPPRLVHGDLWPRNVLVTECDGAWRISAILDAERAFWGEPAAEWIFSFLDLPRAFWHAYGTCLAPARLESAAAFRSLVYQARGALQLILESHRRGFDASASYANFGRAAASLHRIP